jgi:hypothetical protein
MMCRSSLPYPINLSARRDTQRRTPRARSGTSPGRRRSGTALGDTHCSPNAFRLDRHVENSCTVQHPYQNPYHPRLPSLAPCINGAVGGHSVVACGRRTALLASFPWGRGRHLDDPDVPLNRCSLAFLLHADNCLEPAVVVVRPDVVDVQVQVTGRTRVDVVV